LQFIRESQVLLLALSLLIMNHGSTTFPNWHRTSLRCDYRGCAHCDIDAKMIHRAALLVLLLTN